MAPWCDARPRRAPENAPGTGNEKTRSTTMNAHPPPQPCCDDDPHWGYAALPAAQFGEDDPPLGVEALHSVPPELIAGAAR